MYTVTFSSARDKHTMISDRAFRGPGHQVLTAQQELRPVYFH